MACAAPPTEAQLAGNAATTTRPPRFTMEGVGARVVRGPDWKWGKQVINIDFFFVCVCVCVCCNVYMCVRVCFTISMCVVDQKHQQQLLLNNNATTMAGGVRTSAFNNKRATPPQFAMIIANIFVCGQINYIR